jgi:hypothetical protein
MPYLEIAARAMLIVVFATAFATKARNRNAFMSFADSLGSFGIRHRRLQLQTAAIVLTAEAAAAVLTALPATAIWGLALAGLTITVFTAAAVLARKQGRQPTCNCFGSSTATLGTRHVVRNCLIIAVAIAGLAAQPADGQAHIAAAPAVLATGLALITGLAIATWDDIATLLAPPGSR